MTSVGAYVRVSTEKQRENRSHLRQRKRIAEWADRNEYPVDGWEDYHTGDEITEHSTWESIDGVVTDDIVWHEDIAISGQSDQRDGYDRLMDQYDEFDIIVVRELSRFGRDPRTVLADAEEVMESDTDFVSITESFDTTTAMGKAAMRIVAVINGMYSDLASERAEEMVERRREQGKPIGRPKKLSESEIEQVLAWREKDLSYGMIATLVEEQFDVEISRETIRRYCTEADAAA
jgi:DNA invertase Pin-like site-specific DNA recombinase